VKNKNNLIFEQAHKKFEPIHKELYIVLFAQKIVTNLSKIWGWDPGSESRDQEKPIPDPGARGKQMCKVIKNKTRVGWKWKCETINSIFVRVLEIIG
jgi:hypothetical protein